MDSISLHSEWFSFHWGAAQAPDETASRAPSFACDLDLDLKDPADTGRRSLSGGRGKMKMGSRHECELFDMCGGFDFV